MEYISNGGVISEQSKRKGKKIFLFVGGYKIVVIKISGAYLKWSVFQSCSLKSLRLAFRAVTGGCSCYPSIQSVYLGCRSMWAPELPEELPRLLSKPRTGSSAARSLFAGWICCPMSSRCTEPQLPPGTASATKLVGSGRLLSSPASPKCWSQLRSETATESLCVCQGWEMPARRCQLLPSYSASGTGLAVVTHGAQAGSWRRWQSLLHYPAFFQMFPFISPALIYQQTLLVPTDCNCANRLRQKERKIADL